MMAYICDLIKQKSKVENVTITLYIEKGKF